MRKERGEALGGVRCEMCELDGDFRFISLEINRPKQRHHHHFTHRTHVYFLHFHSFDQERPEHH